jgi:hypothetical protein
MHKIATGQDTGGVLGGLNPMSWLTAKNAPQIGANPYQGHWDSLIGQLQQTGGRSLAGDAFAQANATGMNNVLSMSRGGSAGAARQGMQQYGQMQQGQAFGYSNARLQEELARKQMLQAALAGAGNAWFQPQQANLQAQVNTPSNMQMLTGFIGQLAPGLGSILGSGKPKGMSPIAPGNPGAGGYYTPGM